LSGVYFVHYYYYYYYYYYRNITSLRTYKPATWFAKPDIISPLECARHGWVNDGMDLIKCNVCGEKLSFKYTGLDYEDTEDAAVNFAKYLDVIPCLFFKKIIGFKMFFFLAFLFF
jgi:hypothetical protein